MIKLDYKKVVAKFEDLDLNFGRNSEISPDNLKKSELIKYYKKLKNMGFDVPNNALLFKENIRIYVNNIIQIDFAEDEVFFSIGIYYLP